jgi:hypothetical protein
MIIMAKVIAKGRNTLRGEFRTLVKDCAGGKEARSSGMVVQLEDAQGTSQVNPDENGFEMQRP